MNTTNRDVTFGSGPAPSNFVPVAEVISPRRSDIRGKLEDLKSHSLSRVHEVQGVVSSRTSLMKSNLRSGMSDSMTKVQRSMAASPMKWAGIAAGSGFALGMLGRVMSWRSKERQRMPQLVIIETSC
jgi:ElaB/YqjD/DUF883 family membrane-anchored ribosome-binding protein